MSKRKHKLNQKQKRRINKASVIKTDANLRNLTKEISAVNSMLASLKREHKVNTWATKKLINRLNNKQIKIWNSKKGNIRLPKNIINKTQMAAIKKALEQFKASKTSTNAGIRDVQKNVRAGLKKAFSTVYDMSDEDVEFLYRMYEDTDLTRMSIVDQMGSSLVQASMLDAIESHDSKNDFINRLSDYNLINDVNDRKRAERLYDKYVKGR